VLHSTMMDIYANERRLDKVLDVLENNFLGRQDITQYNILMKAYGNCDLANESEKILASLLNGNYDVDMENIRLLFHTLITAWSISCI
jgi:pentatricopeptide repeat protein